MSRGRLSQAGKSPSRPSMGWGSTLEDNRRYTYVLGDATKTYSNPTYNQAMDGVLSGSVATVSRFQWAFVYLRATDDGRRTTGETATDYSD